MSELAIRDGTGKLLAAATGSPAGLAVDAAHEVQRLVREGATRLVVEVAGPQVCACGCGQEVKGMRSDAIYATSGCSRAARRRRAAVREGRNVFQGG